MENSQVVAQQQENAGTATASQSNAVPENEAGKNTNATPNESQGKPIEGDNSEKRFSQEDVDRIVKERLAQKEQSDHKSFMDKLGVKDDDELETLIKKSQSYDATKKALDETKLSTDELAFIKNGIDEKRYDDVRYYLKGKGEELNADNIKAELASHPEWGKQQAQPKPVPAFQSLGAPKEPQTAPDEEAEVESWLGHKLH